MTLRKFIAAAIAALAIGGSTLALTSSADARGGHGGGFRGHAFAGKWHGGGYRHGWHGHRWKYRYGAYPAYGYGYGCSFVKKFTPYGITFVKVCPNYY